MLTILLRYGQLNALFLCRSLHRRDAERVDAAPGDRASARGTVLETSSNWTIAKVFSKKSLGLSVCTCCGEKSHQKGLKVAKYCAKVALLCVRCGSWWQRAVDIVAAATNKERACLWECGQFLSTQNHRHINIYYVYAQNEQCETRRARGDFQLVNQSWMVSLSWADKKKV